MAILSSLNAEHFGTWATVFAYLQDLNRRDTGALAALNAALSAPPGDQRELGEGDGILVLAEVAGDQRVQKGSRLAAVRCAIEAGAAGPVLAMLFLGGGELASDPRLGGAAKRLVEAGVPAVLTAPNHEASRVSMPAGAFARALHASASVVGLSRLKELIGPVGASHAGVNAALFALALAPLPATELEPWKKLLREACAAHKRAPTAARRIGLAPPWPPVLPDAFRELVVEAEKETANVVAIDATKGGVIRGTAGPAGGALAAGQTTPGKPTAPVANAPAIQARAPRAGSLGAPLGSPSSRPVPPPPAPPSEPPPALTEGGEPGRPQSPIRRSVYRRPIGPVIEGPFVTPTRHLPAMNAQIAPGTRPPAAETHPSAPAELPGTVRLPKSAPLEGLAPLPTLSKGPEFDARGRKIPTVNRWDPNTPEWEPPLLPSSEPRPPALVREALGPFALRLKSLFQDRPEAVDRLCAAAEVRALLAGEEQLGKELARELALPRWQKPAPPEQRERLEKVMHDQTRPTSWRLAARVILEKLVSREKTDA